ncbi:MULTISPECIES: hypothetical protein [unclassified Paenibacillus]|uniref:hypothetical protein n=1 Tax=unclassified Paenibacillus TaxID=185978 RepID=UPI0024075569|nr:MULTISPECIES: hypothetical protein [unclassified Paenibacillus]MDF9841779.1 hypothetical protein [Paenibacillus sp. PastF-2]MDF9848540.1 hypothetical protein [Paenibacillus sp. PastM-2]MDF9854939.1 hypothetical protein [Paenibacillus sp. PastF-1]MDH6480208.1 hypothetical protein [Paenibacillus sp. PastH-2]MDH6507808.1 hypothetical protein [Paenibacillus sp. PastM-3]
MQQRVSVTYEDFYKKVMEFNKDDFAEFCHRYQKIFYRFFRATKAIGPLGDLSNDGIITPDKRLACYGFFIDTVDKDGGVANKLKDDFDNMMKRHSGTRCMVFMTKTDGIGPKTQRMLEKLTSRKYQEMQIKERFPDDYEKRIKNYRTKRIEYVDIKDMFDRLRDIKRGETWQYLLNHDLWVEPPMALPDKQLDDPAFMAEWLSVAVKRFDNPEAPVFLKHEELKKLKDCLKDKMERDLRKYEVDSYEKVPYVSWLLLGISTPISEASIGFSPSFEVPKAFWEGDAEVLHMELTPIMLLDIVEKMMYLLKRSRSSTLFVNTDPLFTDLFLQAHSIVESSYKYFFEGAEIDFPHKYYVRKKWQEVFATLVREDDGTIQTNVTSQ